MARPVVGVIGNHQRINDRYPAQAAGEHFMEALSGICGAVPLIFPSLPQASDIGQLLEIFDGVVLTGARPNVHPSHYGAEPTPAYEPYDLNRDAVALEMVRACVERGVPLFAVCRGFQEINVAFGGTLHPEIREIPGRMNHRMPRNPDGSEIPDLDVTFALRHEVRLVKGGAFATLLGAELIRVNTLHGQGILEPGERVVIEGRAEDDTPEAIRVEGAEGFALGVQWHAEYKSVDNDVNRRLFEAFGDALRAHRAVAAA